jgi:ubiquinone/menaquinone biosynthesis C-methylase UbiE
MTLDACSVTAHYGGRGLAHAIRDALVASGKDLARITTRDLAPVDEFHSRGRRATEELAELASPDARYHVLDVGSGIGGPARYLAERFGCRVTGVDLTPAFCETANWLSELTGLADLARFEPGSATELTLAAQSFDLAWAIQMQMNVERKDRLYAEIHRVLKPGSRFVLQELCAGTAGPAHLPAPWANSPDISFLLAPHALHEIIEQAGFETVAWRDTTADAIAWYAQQNTKATTAPCALGIHLVMGEAAKEKRANVERNYREDRLRQVLGAFVRR